MPQIPTGPYVAGYSCQRLVRRTPAPDVRGAHPGPDQNEPVGESGWRCPAFRQAATVLSLNGLQHVGYTPPLQSATSF